MCSVLQSEARGENPYQGFLFGQVHPHSPSLGHPAITPASLLHSQGLQRTKEPFSRGMVQGKKPSVSAASLQ